MDTNQIRAQLPDPPAEITIGTLGLFATIRELCDALDISRAELVSWMNIRQQWTGTS